jgi:hypothetical protein
MIKLSREGYKNHDLIVTIVGDFEIAFKVVFVTGIEN